MAGEARRILLGEAPKKAKPTVVTMRSDWESTFGKLDSPEVVAAVAAQAAAMEKQMQEV